MSHKKYKYNGPQHFEDIKAIDESISQAVKKYDAFRGKSQRIQWSYLDQLAKEMNNKDGKGRRHHCKILQQQELTREYF
jgi:hypothetical protein